LDVFIHPMSDIDHLNLDGNSLRTFLTVLEESSVSAAAVRLGVTQSAVSHTLDKLRRIFNDPLFEREGRGIVPTAKARSLQESVSAILGDLRTLTYADDFDPAVAPLEFTIATNDFPLQLIFPGLLRDLNASGIKPRLSFIPSGVPRANLSRAARCHFLITPAPPAGKDIIRHALFESRMTCFYDASVRKAPATRQAFFDSRYAEVRFSETESSMMVLPSADIAALGEPSVSVPNFSSLVAFVKGTDLITTQLGLMKLGLLHELDSAPLPFANDPLALYLAWHRRDDDDPAHCWLRQQIIETIAAPGID
jgi:DNA-binding transcriptional LysR family regulator